MNEEQKKRQQRLDVVVYSVESKPDYDLIKMLKNHPYLSAKGQVWEAAKAFYLPIAVRDNERYSQSEIRALVLESIFVLLKQLHFLTAEMSEYISDSARFPFNYQLHNGVVNSIPAEESNVETHLKKEDVDDDESLDFSNSGMVYQEQGLW